MTANFDEDSPSSKFQSSSVKLESSEGQKKEEVKPVEVEEVEE